MSDKIVEKTLTVIGVTTSNDFVSGETIYQVAFGQFVTVTQEMIDRLPPQLRQFGVGTQQAVNEAILLIKAKEVPYRVGTQWKFIINNDGSMKLETK